jgi:metal-responsive CopG/Arc/MetJ family transcriptional regulator
MSSAKIAITLDRNLLSRLDLFVVEQKLASRSRAIQQAILEKMDRADSNRLARECSNLDPAFERELAESGLSEELNEWPEY